MKKKLLFVAMLALATISSRASSDYLLEIDGIKGESADATHKDAIEISSFSWGMSNSGSVGGGTGTGKVNFQDLHFTKSVDAASPLLKLGCATGTHIAHAQLYVRKAGAAKPIEYYTITLTDVLVTSVSEAGGNSGDRPTESLSLNFAKIHVEYTPATADGSVAQPIIFNWDVLGNHE